MKINQWTALCLALALLVAGCSKRSDTPGASPPGPPTFSSFDRSSGTNAPIPAHAIRFVEVDLAQVLAFYGELSGRSIIQSPNVPMATKISFDNAAPLTRVEALQALDNVLAAQNFVMVYLGTKYVKIVPAREVASEPGPVVELPADQLPDSSSFVIYIVKLRTVTPSQAVAALQPFAKLPNSIVAVMPNGNNAARTAPPTAMPKLANTFLGAKDNNILILRDYSSNVRRMLQVLEKIDQER